MESLGVLLLGIVFYLIISLPKIIFWYFVISLFLTIGLITYRIKHNEKLYVKPIINFFLTSPIELIKEILND